MKRLTPALLLLLLVSSSCGTLRKATTHGLSEGNYTLKTGHGDQKVYVAVTEDSMLVYSSEGQKILQSTPQVFVFDQDHSKLQLTKSGLDFDIATVLFKYRFKTNTLPAQANANLNVAAYLGYKKEFFKFSSEKKPDGRSRTSRMHYSLDAGLFTGFGSTPMNASTTNGFLTTEYDGLIWQNGIATFVGFDIFTFGVGAGFDLLLDNNRSKWIYNGKPWIGLLIGLTLQN